MLSREEKKRILKDISFERCSIDDVAGVSDLVKSMHPEPPDWMNFRARSPEYYKWVYFENPNGNAIVFCAKHKGRVVSNFAVAPKLLSVLGNEIVIGKTMDMFTYDDYQGLGLMSKLSKLVFDETVNSGITSWYVTPSVNSYPIFKNKWKYRETAQVFYHLCVLDPVSLFRTYSDNSIAGKLLWLPSALLKAFSSHFYTKEYNDVLWLNEIDKSIDSLWDDMKNSPKISIVRDYKYLKWRYITNPDNYKFMFIGRPNNLQGMIVLKETVRRGIKFGEVVDLLYINNDLSLVRRLLKSSLSYFKKSGCSAVQTWAIRGSDLEKAYRSCGFLVRRKEIKVLLSPDSPHSHFYSLKDWHFTQGDGNDI